MPENRDPALPWLLFDIGGVLITRPDDIGALARALDPAGVAGEDAERRVREAFDAHREPYDRGGSAREFWDAVAADVDAATPPRTTSGSSSTSSSAAGPRPTTRSSPRSTAPSRRATGSRC
ncbi:hypothetical protein [Clavibacter zhangzhiyongii]|uniref:hypothetical protein n=1 Tax=Clavibacter zhangzhiyongii TaxID=2768071 RepID=UPI0039E035D0